MTYSNSEKDHHGLTSRTKLLQRIRKNILKNGCETQTDTPWQQLKKLHLKKVNKSANTVNFLSCWTQTSFETAKEGPHRHKQRCLVPTHKLQFLPLWQIYQCFFWARPLHYCISFILITVGSIKVSLSFSIINNCASRLEFKAQYSTRTPPQAGQVPFLQFSSLWCWGQTKWYVCHTPLPLEQNLVLLLQLNSAGFLSRNAKWNQCLGFPGWAWRSQPLYHFSALSFLFLSLSPRASNWHTADWKQHASQGSRCTILQPFGAPFLSLWPFFFLLFQFANKFCLCHTELQAKGTEHLQIQKSNKTQGRTELILTAASKTSMLDITGRYGRPSNSTIATK